ncbi:MAG TPA: Spy/CpxP family protein refolding chaperone [Thermoanaerobaculia bacterium]|nr:Spy/CpxP family protein refolding chaperone [Thermoanaerobaculia bacterium]
MKHFLRTSLVPIAAALALALVAAPLLAVDPPAGPAPAAQGPHGPLAGYLRCLHIVDLTDVQKADVRALLEAARPKLEALHVTLRADREALRAALTATPPDPCVVGAAFLKVEADVKAIGEELKAVRTAIEALLTPEQKAKLEGCLRAPKPNAEDEGEEG